MCMNQSYDWVKKKNSQEQCATKNVFKMVLLQSENSSQMPNFFLVTFPKSLLFSIAALFISGLFTDARFFLCVTCAGSSVMNNSANIIV